MLKSINFTNFIYEETVFIKDCLSVSSNSLSNFLHSTWILAMELTKWSYGQG